MNSLDNNKGMFSRWSCVLQYKDKENNILINLDVLESMLDSFTSYIDYYFILHDKDILDTGEMKTPHIHLIIDLKGCRKRFSTFLKYLVCDILRNSVPANCVSIDRCYNLYSSIRYLLHKDNIDKYQYNYLSVITNNVGILDSALQRERLITYEYLENLCIDKKCNKREIMRSIGLDLYLKYWRCIDVITDSIK